MVKILQCNINHCRIAQDLLAQYELEKRIGITIISEPYRIPKFLDWASNTNDTVAIHWNCNLVKSSRMIRYIGEYVLAVQWQEFNIIACYFPPNLSNDEYGDFLAEMEYALDEMDRSKTIICGDFNSKSQTWGARYTDGRGERLDRWMSSKDFRLINEGSSPTCIRPQGYSIVDLTWAAADVQRKINDWKVLHEETFGSQIYLFHN